MLDHFFHLLKFKVEIFALENGFIVSIQRPEVPGVDFKPLIDFAKSQKAEGEEWKQKEKDPEEEEKIKPGMYMFSSQDELVTFLTDLLI